MPTPPILDVTDASNWQQIYDVQLEAQPSAVPNRWYPIPPQVIPAQFTSYTLAIGAANNKGKPNWNLAFYLHQLIQVPGIGRVEAASARVILGLSLIRFPHLSESYYLKAKIPKWHQEMQFTIWQYVGQESDVLDVLAEIKSGTAEH